MNIFTHKKNILKKYIFLKQWEIFIFSIWFQNITIKKNLLLLMPFIEVKFKKVFLQK